MGPVEQSGGVVVSGSGVSHHHLHPVETHQETALTHDTHSIVSAWMSACICMMQ